MIPLIVEAPRDDVNLVWLCASRSTLSTGMSFAARGRRWVVTGLNPSGVTYRCRELPSAPSGESTAPASAPGGSKQ